MNAWQVARQIRYLLQQATWEDGSTPVFAPSSVVVTSTPTEQTFADRRMPVAIVIPGVAQNDPEFSGDYPEIVRQEFRVAVAVQVQGDAVGEVALLGANRSGQSASDGRGLLEIGEQVRNALLRADDDDGVRLSLFAASGAVAQPGANMGYVAVREYVFVGIATTSRFYRPALSMTAVGGTGQVDLTFGIPALRFDTSHLVLRRASGSTAPSSVTGGTGVTLASDLPTTHTDSGLAGGTYSYALFVAYDEYGDGVNFRYSAAVVAEGITVTASANATWWQGSWTAGTWTGSGWWRAA